MKDLITRLWYDKFSTKEAQAYILRAYSENISLTKIEKIYKQLDKISGKNK